MKLGKFLTQQGQNDLTSEMVLPSWEDCMHILLKYLSMLWGLYLILKLHLSTYMKLKNAAPRWTLADI